MTQRDIRIILICSLGVFLASPTSRAEIIDSSAAGFTIVNTRTIAAPPGEAYHRMVSDIGKWWNPRHTYSGESRNLSVDPTPGGRFEEKLPNGGWVRHMTVVYVDPGKTIRFEGGLGPLQSMGVAGSLTWEFLATEGGTNVKVSYVVGGYRPGGLASFSPVVDRVLLEQLVRLKNFVEKGKPE